MPLRFYDVSLFLFFSFFFFPSCPFLFSPYHCFCPLLILLLASFQASDLDEPPDIFQEDNVGALALNWLAVVARVEGSLALVSSAQGRYLRAREAQEGVGGNHSFFSTAPIDEKTQQLTTS